MKIKKIVAILELHQILKKPIFWECYESYESKFHQKIPLLSITCLHHFIHTSESTKSSDRVYT